MNFLEYIKVHPEQFYAVVAAITVYNAAMFYRGGRKAEKRFPDLSLRRIQFRERGASGHSKKSILTTMGGASRVLEVIVTDGELWIRGIWPMFTYIGTKYDLTHRIPVNHINKSPLCQGSCRL